MKKILNYIIIIFSLLALIIVYYKSEIYWDGNKRFYYFYDFLLFGFIFILSVIFFFISKKLKTYLIVFLSCFIISLYFFELFITFNHLDSKSRFDYFKEELKKDKNIKLAYGSTEFYNYQNLDILPLSGISNSKTIMCNELGFFSIYNSDRYGFNNPDSEWEKNNYKYLLVGDSFVHGACVNRPDDIASNLRVISGQHVLNLGYGGHGTLSKYGILKEYFPGNVEKILWFYYEGNDLDDLKNELNNKILVKYFNNENFKQNLINFQKKIDDLKNNHLKNIKPKKTRSQFYNIIFLFNSRYLIKRIFFWDRESEKPFDEFEVIIRKVKRFADDNESEVIFIYLPEYLRFVSPNYDNKNLKKIKKIVETNNIYFLNTTEVFNSVENPLDLFPLKKSGHYNQEGYTKISELIHQQNIQK